MSPFFVIALLVVLVAMAVHAGRVGEQFHRDFPPISDAEFLARCSPGVNPAVALKVRRLVATHLAVEYEWVYPSSRFINDLGAE